MVTEKERYKRNDTISLLWVEDDFREKGGELKNQEFPYQAPDTVHV